MSRRAKLILLALLAGARAASAAVEVRAGASGYLLAVELGNPSDEAAIGDAVLELAAQPPWLTGTAIGANGGPIAPGEERRVTVTFGVAAGAPDGARGELVLRVAAEPGVFPDHSEIRIPLVVRAPPPPPPPPAASGTTVWLHPSDTTCCPADTGGVPNYAFHGTRTDDVRAGAIVLRTFPDEAQMMAWVCSHEIVPHYWAGTYARIDGYHVTRVPCAVGAASAPPPPPPPAPPPVAATPPDPPQGGAEEPPRGEAGGWEPPRPAAGSGSPAGASGTSGWTAPVRQQPSPDPCRGPRPERRRALERLGQALERQDLDAVTASLAGLAPECPGDAADLGRLRDAGVAIARAEADANASRMRSAIARHHAAKQRSAEAWAAAAGVLQGALSALQSSSGGGVEAIGSGAPGSGGSTSSGAGAGGPTGGSPACYLNIPASVRGIDGKPGVRWYVVVQAGTTTAVSVVPAAEGQAPPFGGAAQVSGPYERLTEAEGVARRHCPSSMASPFQ